MGSRSQRGILLMTRNWKRLLAFAGAVLMLTAGAPAGAEEMETAQYSGYLFQMKEDAPITMSLMAEEADSGITAVMPEIGIYKADDMVALAQYIKLDWLEYVEPNYYVELYDSYPNDPHYLNGDQWQLDALGMQYAWDRGLDGSGVVIGVIDSGYDRDHEDLQGPNIHNGMNYLDFKNGMLTDPKNTEDTVGHGTMVAGLIGAGTNNGIGGAGVAPGATILPLRAFSASSGPIEAVIRAISGGVNGEAEGLKCDIISMSFGVYKEKLDAQGYSSDLKSLEAAIDYASKMGVIMVAAAGNDYNKVETIKNKDTKEETRIDFKGLLSYPASFDTVVSVGSVDKNKNVASSSQKNEKVWVTAPGVSIFSTSYNGNYASGSGTSYATPIVSGIAALAKQEYPDLTSSEFMDVLAASAIHPNGSDRDKSYGYGIVNIPAFFRTLEGSYTKDPSVVPTDAGLAVSVGYYNLIPQENAVVMAAGYLDSGRLAVVDQVPVAMGAWRTQVTVELTSPVPVSEVRLFLLDGSTWKPLADKVTIPVPPDGGSLKQ